MLKTVEINDPAIVDTLVKETSHNGGAVMLERDGEPAVVVVSVSKYQAMERTQFEQAWAKVLAYAETDPFGHLSSEELEEWIQSEVDAVREKRFQAGHHR